MGAIQYISCPTRGIILIEPNARNGGSLSSVYQIPYLKASHLDASTSCKFRQRKLQGRLVYNGPKNERCASVRAFGKKGDSISKNEEVFKKTTDVFRGELTVQDLLREYMKGRQLSGSGGGGKFFGGGGGHHSGDSEGEGFAEQYDEFLQVIMATIGLIILYLLITSSTELTRLTRDCIKHLQGAEPSPRMVRYMEKWRGIYESITWKGTAQ